MNFFVTS